MADTKKEHYVPRCYLKNFADENERINVFDRYKLQSREHQRIIDIAMENYFYDINFNDMIQLVETDKQDKVKSDIISMLGVEKWEDINTTINLDKYVEKEFFSRLESIYNIFLNKFIEKSHNGNQWVIDNCSCCSETEKILFSIFIAIQFIRTKAFRQTLNDTIEQLYQTLAYKVQQDDENALSKDDFAVSANKDYVKLEHASMLLNEDMALKFAETMCNHIWVMYVNKTDYPFYTSDNPVATIPHKFDEYMSYSGLSSEGIEIVFPLSPNLLLAMYDKNTYSSLFQDRSYLPIFSKEVVEDYNRIQIINSHRCIFSSKNDFEFAKTICEKYPKLQQYQSRVEVL